MNDGKEDGMKSKNSPNSLPNRELDFASVSGQSIVSTGTKFNNRLYYHIAF